MGFANPAQENLSDVDDDIGDYLITEDAEVAAKESIWLSMNEDYLVLQKEKDLRKAEDEAAGRGVSNART